MVLNVQVPAVDPSIDLSAIASGRWTERERGTQDVSTVTQKAANLVELLDRNEVGCAFTLFLSLLASVLWSWRPL